MLNLAARKDEQKHMVHGMWLIALQMMPGVIAREYSALGNLRYLMQSRISSRFDSWTILKHTEVIGQILSSCSLAKNVSMF